MNHCGCFCHSVNVAEDQPFCLCDNEYSSLCNQRNDWNSDYTEEELELLNIRTVNNNTKWAEYEEDY